MRFFNAHLVPKTRRPHLRGMTLIETLVAITILTVAIVAPMSLTVKSLSAAYYARDQITAFHLAQEALESVRAVRDANILKIAFSEPDAGCNPVTLLCGIPIDQNFTIDTRNNAMVSCGGVCPYLATDGNLYGYEPGWSNTIFRRTVHASFIDVQENEIRLDVTVEWKSGTNQTRQFTISSTMYRWVDDSIGS